MPLLFNGRTLKITMTVSCNVVVIRSLKYSCFYIICNLLSFTFNKNCIIVSEWENVEKTNKYLKNVLWKGQWTWFLMIPYAMPDLQRYPYNLNLIKIATYFFELQKGLILLISLNCFLWARIAQITFTEKPQTKINRCLRVPL